MAILGLGKLGLPKIGIHGRSLLGNDYGFELRNTYYKILNNNAVGQSIKKQLEKDPRVIALNGKMVSSGGGGSRFETSSLAAWWIWRANEVGPDQANQDLDAYLSTDHISAIATLWVYGVVPEQPIELQNAIRLVPINDMPDSSDKEEFLRTNMRWQGPAPYAALTMIYSSPKLMPNMTINGPEPGFDEAMQGITDAHNALSIISTVLNCIDGVCCLPGYATSYMPANVPLGPFASSGGGTPIFDVLPRRPSAIKTGHEQTILELATAFSKIPDSQKLRFIRAIHRIAQAKGRTDDGDRSLDLGISLEMMLLNSEHGGQELPGQLNLHFRLRGSWLIGKTADERKKLYRVLGKIYSLRSQLAHNGYSEELDKMRPEDRARMLGEHLRIGEQIFRRLILEAPPKDWPSLILGT